jgi:hypothetical protein
MPPTLTSNGVGGVGNKVITIHKKMNKQTNPK